MGHAWVTEDDYLRQCLCIDDLGLDTKQPVLEVSDKQNLNQSPQLQRLPRKFTSSKLIYGTFQNVNNKGTDQSARMRKLVCAFAVRKPRRQVSTSVIPPIMYMAFYMYMYITS